jgi:hypothetical protein
MVWTGTSRYSARAVVLSRCSTFMLLQVEISR